ncbi:hypothetical protein GW17_00026807 [Ensete ventricosum]|uniref:Uncharacterized protein n=1 Tax=Ensete ventricosum TaxID=4639 RepID=A0A427ARA8_ENSVE|nr:hypothetical protein B296_00025952 [Ensete ventricosum]RWW09690.1 hypothetical protein GW17_00026807 [Ensete ventricosum]RZR86511.1 hypothetical protein BHM03_00013730 [Ensete ventricosum]
MGGTYQSANLTAHGPPTTSTILLPGSRSQDADPNISILREEEERGRGKEKARGRDGVVHLEAGQVCGRVVELAGRDTTAMEEGDQVVGVNAEGGGEDR